MSVKNMYEGLLPPDLPDGNQMVVEGVAIGNDITMGTSLLCETYGARSEVEYKRKMVSEGRIMASMNIGMQTWEETARALRRIHERSAQLGFRIDRYQMQLDRRMGLPRQLWTRAAKETGPMLETREDWQATSQVAPIQPHLGDMMIGSPASVDNTCYAIEAGVNYVGNMSQFNWKYPGWPGDDAEQMTEMVKALGVMASKVDDDAMVHSYLDDGFPAQFKDFSSYVGWAMFERYIVNDLIGARLSVSYGGLTHNPMSKAAMVLALETITPDGHMNAFYHSNTTAYSRDCDKNFAVLAIDDLYMMLANLRAGGGAAVLSVPVTEAARIPTWEEIVQAQAVGRRVADDAERLMESFNWPHVEALSEQLQEGGKKFFENLVQGLDELGIDIRDPLQMLLAVRRLGALAIETQYGAGTATDNDSDPYDPVVASDTHLDFMERRGRIRSALVVEELPNGRDVKIVVGSADVHEYALSLIVDALKHLGLDPIVAGTSVDPDEFAELARESGAQVVLVSTHNGMALTYAQQLQQELKFRGLKTTIAMGGILNQDLADADAPVDVRDDLEKMGVRVCNDVSEIVAVLKHAA